MAEGLQEALRRLGGTPLEYRTQIASRRPGGVQELSSTEARKDLTERYEALSVHYGMTTTHNNHRVSHENGAVESPHGQIKRRIAQALLLRGSAGFAAVKECG